MYTNIYSDETGHPHEGVQAVAVLSCREDVSHKLEKEISNKTIQLGVDELKFTKLKTKISLYDLVYEVFDLLISEIEEGTLSLHVLVDRYGSSDSLSLMYEYLLSTLLDNKSTEKHIHFFPDQKNALEWPSQIIEGGYTIPVQEVNSQESPLVQVCDLFAGLARDVMLHSGKYLFFSRFESDETGDKKFQCRAELLRYFLSRMKSIGVDIDLNRGWIHSDDSRCYFGLLDQLPRKYLDFT